MTSKILTGAIFFLVMGALMYQRFDMPAQLVVSVVGIEGESAYTLDDEIPRGSLLMTEDEFLSVTIGPDRVLKLGPRTTVELKSLSPEGIVLDMTRGRVVFVSEAQEGSTTIETNHTSHQLGEGALTMVNFDFLEMITIVPLHGEVLTELNLLDLAEPLRGLPLSIHETEPVTWQVITDLQPPEGEVADFYRWSGILTQ